jgi:phosphonopyruvate decarboxylase
VKGTDFVGLLDRQGFDFYAGVPCSLIEEVIAALEHHPRLPYVSAVREDVAVGLAGGAWFAGRRPVVLMQNSGLGTSLNALASFSLMYRLPLLLVVTWRGHAGKDAPEHILMGAITPHLLDTLGIPFRVLSEASVEADIAWARAEMDALMQPVALLVQPGLFPQHHAAAHPENVRASSGGFAAAILPRGRQGGARHPARDDRRKGDEVPLRGTSPLRGSRLAAIAAAVKALGDEPVIHANGYPSRESCAVADRPQNFYMIGSMGLAAPIGLGVALGHPRRRTVVFDGDGNLLMNLGVLANVAALAPDNFVHCVFDNEVYGSTGNQRSPSAHVRLDRVAAAAGYRNVVAVDDPEDVTASLRAMLGSAGPHFLLVKVTREEGDVPRIPHTPEVLRDRFRTAVGPS